MPFTSDRLKKALSLLRRYRLDFSMTPLAEKVVRLSNPKLRPTLKPYHLEPLKDYIIPFISGLELYAEAKYDGTHLLIDEKGIYKHNGEPLASDQLAGLLYIACVEPRLISRLFKAVEEGFTAAFELYGSRYTPMGFHRGHSKPYDIAVFEIARENRWITPPLKYKVIASLKLPSPKVWHVGRAKNLRSKLERIASLPEAYEGAVFKADGSAVKDNPLLKPYLKPGFLLAFKVKVKTPPLEAERARKQAGKPRPKTKQVKLPLSAEQEVLNEIGKIMVEKGLDYMLDRRNMGRMIERCLKHLQEHPAVWSEIEKQKITLKNVKRAVAALILKQAANKAKEKFDGGK